MTTSQEFTTEVNDVSIINTGGGEKAIIKWRLITATTESAVPHMYLVLDEVQINGGALEGYEMDFDASDYRMGDTLMPSSLLINKERKEITVFV